MTGPYADASAPDLLGIIHYPAGVLRETARPVEAVTDEVRAVARAMVRLMHEAPGIGLAAPQVGLPWRMFVCDVPPDEDGTRLPDDEPATATTTPMVCINPVLSDYSRDLVAFEEGCLSLPEIHGDVRRPTTCTITALDIDGNEFTRRATDLLARCWQHEFDHLEGVLITDRMDPRGKRRNKRAMEDLESGARLA